MSCHIDEEDRARVQNDSAVLVRVDAIPNHELKGAVAEISMMAKLDFRAWPPTRNFDVLITLKDSDPPRSGMSAPVATSSSSISRTSCLCRPSAMFQRGRTMMAYVVNGTSIDPRQVTVLRRGRDQIAIATGLREGERVAIKDPEAEAAPK